MATGGSVYVCSSYRKAYRWARLCEALLCPRHSESKQQFASVSTKTIAGRVYWCFASPQVHLVDAALNLADLLEFRRAAAMLCGGEPAKGMHAPTGFVLSRGGPDTLLHGGAQGAWPGLLPPVDSAFMIRALACARFTGPVNWAAVYWPSAFGWSADPRVTPMALIEALCAWPNTYGPPPRPKFAGG